MKLNLIEFINNHKDWEKLLSEKPYCIKIKRDGGYIMFNYDQIESDFSLDIVKECRGIILRESDFKIVCFPFTKFFNIDEPYASDIDWSSVKVQEKVDGSLIKLWCDNGIWNLSTNGCIDAFKAELSSDLCPYDTFGKLFMSVFDTRIFSYLNPDYTYMFELVSPYNRIVVPYLSTSIYHIGTRDNVSGLELDCDIGIKKPKEYNLKTEEDIKNAASELPFDEEGYVLVDSKYHRVKVKSPAYVKAHRLVNNGSVTVEKIIDMILINEQDEFLSYFPEYRDDFNRINNALIKYQNHLIKLEKETLLKCSEIKDRKEFALWATEIGGQDSVMCFKLFDSKINNWKDYYNVLTTKKIIERIKKYE